MTANEKAILKLREEIEKDIQLAVQLSNNCGMFELLFYVYQLHWVRLLDRFPNASNQKSELVNLYSNAIEESLKYLISVIVKFGKVGITLNTIPYFNLELTQQLLKLANYINSKYESQSLIQLFEVEVSGERNQNVRLDMSSVESNKEVKTFFGYFYRLEKDNDVTQNFKLDLNDLIQNFLNEYHQVEDLFQQELNISIHEYCDLIKELIQRVTTRIAKSESKFTRLENGNVDVQDVGTLIHFSSCLLFTEDELFKGFNERVINVIKRLTFKSQEFDELQLRFHYLTRKPVIKKGEEYIISGELLLDSLFTNIHYSLIESASIKHEYIHRQSQIFLDKVAAIAAKYGYSEIGRDKDLFEGKNQIGDIDLILQNTNGHFLLIEGKNHALPMDVYFKDVVKTRDHLNYLKSKWESKVIKRVDHLKTKHKDYGISDNYHYIIVSRFPEIISHFSNLFIISIQEFENWLKEKRFTYNFQELNNKFYNPSTSNLNEEVLRGLELANLVFGTFAKE